MELWVYSRPKQRVEEFGFVSGSRDGPRKAPLPTVPRGIGRATRGAGKKPGLAGP